MNKNNDSLTSPSIQILNRKMARAYFKESTRIHKHLANRIKWFFDDLFIADEAWEYEKLFKFHITQWFLEINWIKKQIKPRYCEVKDYWFSYQFKGATN